MSYAALNAAKLRGLLPAPVVRLRKKCEICQVRAPCLRRPPGSGLFHRASHAWNPYVTLIARDERMRSVFGTDGLVIERVAVAGS